MATLKELVERKLDQIEWDETNLEKGRVWAYSPGTEYNDFNKCFCWISPGRGQVIIDIWGAGGSGARMCCCGFGIPGNPGAWSRKCICVDTGCIICGNVGKACNNADAFVFPRLFRSYLHMLVRKESIYRNRCRWVYVCSRW
jgi:hypothetical protein